MTALDFGYSERFLRPDQSIIGGLASPFRTTRDFVAATILNFAQDDPDLFHFEWYNGEIELTNMYDLVSNVIMYWSNVDTETSARNRSWFRAFDENESEKYMEGNQRFKSLIASRVPSILGHQLRDVFIRQVSGNYLPVCRCVAWHESEQRALPNDVATIWNFWLAGYFPCGFEGCWPSAGKYVLFEPH